MAHYQARFRRRRGYVLIYFGMIAFALMAIAALAIDVGFVLVTRSQMETATSAAALEGLRFRDGVSPQWMDQSATSDNPLGLDSTIVTAMKSAGLDPTSLDNVQRWAAQQIIVNTFDDDLKPSDGDTLNLGAGPVVGFTNSPAVPADVQAIAAQTINQPTVYNPSPILSWPLQFNTTNATAGDMVSGTYSSPFNAAYYAPLQQTPSQTPVESDDYTRQDFLPTTTSTSSTTSTTPTSFLVRMKRSSNPNDAPVAGISSAGPPLPYLFGWGSLMQTQQQGGNTVWAKSQGITVRATSIAKAVPALTVGPSIASLPISDGTQTVTLNIQGIAPFALNLAFWNTLQPGVAASEMIDSLGNISGTSPSDGLVTRVTTLGANVGASDTTVTVASAAGFPMPSDYATPASIAPFTIRIENELMQVTGGAGTTAWTVERGVLSTQAAAHLATNSTDISTLIKFISRSHELTVTNPDGSTQNLVIYDPPAVGQPLAGSLPNGLVFPLNATDLFVPIYETITDPSTGGRSVVRIIAFGQASMTLTSSASPPYTYPISVSITQLASTIAVQAATGRFFPSWDNLTAGELNQILGPSAANSTVLNPLLTPALVRSE